jgi:hypothetical protein
MNAPRAAPLCATGHCRRARAPHETAPAVARGLCLCSACAARARPFPAGRALCGALRNAEPQGSRPRARPRAALAAGPARGACRAAPSSSGTASAALNITLTLTLIPCAQGYTFHIYHRIYRGLAAEGRGRPGGDDGAPLAPPGKRGAGGRGGGIPARYSVLEDSAGSSDGDEEACVGIGSALGLGALGLGRRNEPAGAAVEMAVPAGGMSHSSRNDSAVSFDARAARRKL